MGGKHARSDGSAACARVPLPQCVEGRGCRRVRAAAARGFRMTRFWDTNLFVYLLEGGPFAARVRQVRARMLERGDQLVTSALTLGELLVRPREHGVTVARAPETAIRQIAAILPFDAACAPRYATIRADRRSRRRTRSSSPVPRRRALISSSPATIASRENMCRI